jgi:ribosomal protein S16
MKKKLIIKSYKTSEKSNDNISKVIVVGYNTAKLNGRYIEKLGHYSKFENNFFYFLDLKRLAY